MNDIPRIARWVTILCVCCAASVAATMPDRALSVLERWKIGGSGGWDYLSLDASGQRLFVSRGNRVDVVNTRTGAVIASIPDTIGVHGIALAEGSRRGYTSNGRDDSVTEFDLDSLKIIQKTHVPGHNPDAILFEPRAKHVFTFNGASKDVTVLDASTLQILATLPLADKPEFAVQDGAGMIFVNIESAQGQIAVIDAATLSVKATWPLPGCESPSGLAIDRDHHRLFSVCDNKTLVVTDAGGGSQVARLPIGERPDAAAYDPQRALVFSSNGEGTLTEIFEESPDRYRVVANLATQRGARTMAVDSATGRIYLATADFTPAPPASAEQPHPRPAPVDGSFTILVAGPQHP